MFWIADEPAKPVLSADHFINGRTQSIRELAGGDAALLLLDRILLALVERKVMKSAEVVEMIVPVYFAAAG